MITVRKSQNRGHAREEWLDSYHTFSFDTYQDPEQMGFRSLRVINEDRVEPGRGFPLHPHRDMEILTFVLEGALEHRDDLGSRETIHAGEVQRITAGTGIMHAEYNPSSVEAVHLLQIWIHPDQKGLVPDYESRRFSAPTTGDGMRLIASANGRDGSAHIHQDASLYVGELARGGKVDYRLEGGRHAWLQVTDGALSLNGEPLAAGDGAAVSNEGLLTMSAEKDSRFILFDLN